jgi:peptidoglycan/LPS O-acetylase OafA/YrhL
MKKRITQLDGVRAVAISAVFIHHAFHAPLLWMGVDLFFILSGFLITGILISQKSEPLSSFFGHFYERRARRILPPYTVLMVLTTAFFGIGSWIHHWYFYLFLMNLLLALQIHRPDVLVVLWSLAVEEQFYLVWPFIIRSFSEKSIARLAVGILILAPVLRWFCTPLFRLEWPIYTMTPFRMDCLAAGALLAVIARRRPDWLPKYGLYGLFLPLISFGGLLWLGKHGYTTYGNSQVGNTFIYVCTLWACFGVMTWALSGKFVAILKWSPVVYVGRISYTIYLTHLLAIWICSRFIHNHMLAASAAVPLVIGFASLSWFVMEKPLLEGKRNKVRVTVTVPS